MEFIVFFGLAMLTLGVIFTYIEKKKRAKEEDAANRASRLAFWDQHRVEQYKARSSRASRYIPTMSKPGTMSHALAEENNRRSSSDDLMDTIITTYVVSSMFDSSDSSSSFDSGGGSSDTSDWSGGGGDFSGGGSSGDW